MKSHKIYRAKVRYIFNGPDEYDQALSLALRLHFNLKVAPLISASQSTNLLVQGKEGVVRRPCKCRDMTIRPVNKGDFRAF